MLLIFISASLLCLNSFEKNKHTLNRGIFHSLSYMDIILKSTSDKIRRWNADDMLSIGQKLFSKIYKKKKAANHNHEIHFLAREINDWLPKGIQS